MSNSLKALTALHESHVRDRKAESELAAEYFQFLAKYSWRLFASYSCRQRVASELAATRQASFLNLLNIRNKVTHQLAANLTGSYMIRIPREQRTCQSHCSLAGIVCRACSIELSCRHNPCCIKHSRRTKLTVQSLPGHHLTKGLLFAYVSTNLLLYF